MPPDCAGTRDFIVKDAVNVGGGGRLYASRAKSYVAVGVLQMKPLCVLPLVFKISSELLCLLSNINIELYNSKLAGARSSAVG
jgi:hypothetical protein